jgi:hypothetical protein
MRAVGFLNGMRVHSFPAAVAAAARFALQKKLDESAEHIFNAAAAAEMYSFEIVNLRFECNGLRNQLLTPAVQSFCVLLMTKLSILFLPWLEILMGKIFSTAALWRFIYTIPT